METRTDLLREGGDGELILVTGGSANGKSTFAVKYCRGLPGERLFLDTTPPDEGDPRTDALIEALRRAGDYRVAGLSDLPPDFRTDVIVLDCICKLTAGKMFGEAGTVSDPLPAVTAAVRRLRASCRTLMVITNDVGGDGTAYGAGTDAYIAALGRVNAALAEAADRVWEIVCGIPTPVKGLPPASRTI